MQVQHRIALRGAAGHKIDRCGHGAQFLYSTMAHWQDCSRLRHPDSAPTAARISASAATSKLATSASI